MHRAVNTICLEVEKRHTGCSAQWHSPPPPSKALTCTMNLCEASMQHSRAKRGGIWACETLVALWMFCNSWHKYCKKGWIGWLSKREASVNQNKNDQVSWPIYGKKNWVDLAWWWTLSYSTIRGKKCQAYAMVSYASYARSVCAFQAAEIARAHRQGGTLSLETGHTCIANVCTHHLNAEKWNWWWALIHVVYTPHLCLKSGWNWRDEHLHGRWAASAASNIN